MGSDCGDDSTAFGLVLLGMGLAVLASVGSTFGLILQKLAQLQNDALPPEEQYTKTGSLICSPTWIFGLVLLVAVPFPLDLVAFSLAPQSLVVPLTGVTLILNQVIAPFILKEKVTCIDWMATAVITVGIVFTTAFGSHCSYEYTVDQMIDFFDPLAFQIAESFFLVSMIFCWWWVTWGAKSCCSEAKVDQHRSLAYGYMSGAVGGQQQIFLKATGELLETSVNGKGEWDRWESWALTLTCVALAVGQIQLLNKGLGLWTAVKYLPVYNVCLILCSTTYGSIFYQEYKGLDTLGYIMFPIGVTIVVAGSLVLTLKNEPGTTQDPTVAPCNPTKGKTDETPCSGIITEPPDSPKDFKGRTDDTGEERPKSPIKDANPVQLAYPVVFQNGYNSPLCSPKDLKPRWKSAIHVTAEQSIATLPEMGTASIGTPVKILDKIVTRAVLPPIQTSTRSASGSEAAALRPGLAARPVLAPITRPHAAPERTPTPGSEHRKRSKHKVKEGSPRKVKGERRMSKGSPKPSPKSSPRKGKGSSPTSSPRTSPSKSGKGADNKGE